MYLLILVAASATNSTNVPRPNNILFFLIDDYGFGDASFKNGMYNDSTASPPTPSIDALAMSGVRLESYYVSALRLLLPT
jgi:arylsulfatase A-like enzyme